MTDTPMAQRTLVMTGGSSGLGRRAAVHLLRDHPDLHLLLTVRDGHGQRLAAELTAETGNPNISTVPCDLASLSDIRTAAAEITGRLDTADLPPLHGFLGNAGVQMPSTTRTTADGYEMTFGVNVLANYLMLRLLLTRFAAPSRLIITGSVSHFADFRHNLGVVPRPNWTDTETIATPGSGRPRTQPGKASGPTRQANSPSSTWYTLSRDGCRQASTCTHITQARCLAPDSTGKPAR